ncbi:hypothetical protein GWI33_011987 [Rhynchophorus ferrugineus]|uniref:Uncharacterized protein n=1 Tax=Rhynchophorus ferrugineus TaxID=354439 RepID=A0A834MJW0_RHYFE|nr:hypothetical protein GWI33_011987 [Rhynchophorus ferrugineus]
MDVHKEREQKAGLCDPTPTVCRIVVDDEVPGYRAMGTETVCGAAVLKSMVKSCGTEELYKYLIRPAASLLHTIPHAKMDQNVPAFISYRIET